MIRSSKREPGKNKTKQQQKKNTIVVESAEGYAEGKWNDIQNCIKRENSKLRNHFPFNNALLHWV